MLGWPSGARLQTAKPQHGLQAGCGGGRKARVIHPCTASAALAATPAAAPTAGQAEARLLAGSPWRCAARTSQLASCVRQSSKPAGVGLAPVDHASWCCCSSSSITRWYTASSEVSTSSPSCTRRRRCTGGDWSQQRWAAARQWMRATPLLSSCCSPGFCLCWPPPLPPVFRSNRCQRTLTASTRISCLLWMTRAREANCSVFMLSSRFSCSNKPAGGMGRWAGGRWAGG